MQRWSHRRCVLREASPASPGQHSNLPYVSVSWFIIPLPRENVRTFAPQEQKWYLTSLGHQEDSGLPSLVLSPRIYRVSFLRPGQEPRIQKQASVKRKDTRPQAQPFSGKSTAISTRKNKFTLQRTSSCFLLHTFPVSSDLGPCRGRESTLLPPHHYPQVSGPGETFI